MIQCLPSAFCLTTMFPIPRFLKFRSSFTRLFFQKGLFPTGRVLNAIFSEFLHMWILTLPTFLPLNSRAILAGYRTAGQHVFSLPFLVIALLSSGTTCCLYYNFSCYVWLARCGHGMDVVHPNMDLWLLSALNYLMLENVRLLPSEWSNFIVSAFFFFTLGYSSPSSCSQKFVLWH